MLDHPKSWEEFWNLEASLLSRSMPSPLTGGAPISVLCLQPAQSKRMAYMARAAKVEDLIFLPFGPNSEKQLYKRDGSGLWDSQLITHKASTIAKYLQLDESIRKRLYEIESPIYGKELYNHVGFHLLPGKKYRLQTVVPSPLFHSLKKWWIRLPRLGLAYTVSERLGAFSLPHSSRRDNAAEKLLLIAATSAGNRILSTRLKLVFANRYRSPDEIRLIRNKKIDPDEILERKVAQDLCIHGVHPTSEVSWDNC